jgi:hypothetical protein
MLNVPDIIGLYGRIVHNTLLIQFNKYLQFAHCNVPQHGFRCCTACGCYVTLIEVQTQA